MAKCGAPWCSNELFESKHGKPGNISHVDGVAICRTCYVYVDYEAKRLGVSIQSLSVYTMKVPRRYPKRTKASRCPRKGCDVLLPAKVNGQKFKRIGQEQVCRSCYQAAWRVAKALHISMEEALKGLPPKVRKTPKTNYFWKKRWVK
jgi:hypothetical protein